MERGNGYLKVWKDSIEQRNKLHWLQAHRDVDIPESKPCFSLVHLALFRLGEHRDVDIPEEGHDRLSTSHRPSPGSAIIVSIPFSCSLHRFSNARRRFLTLLASAVAVMLIGNARVTDVAPLLATPGALEKMVEPPVNGVSIHSRKCNVEGRIYGAYC